MNAPHSIDHFVPQPLSREVALALLARFDAHHAHLLARFHEEMQALSPLPPALRALCLVGGAVALRATGQTREFMRDARTAGATPAQILEVVMLNTNFAGFAAMSEGLQIFARDHADACGPGERPEHYPDRGEVDGFDAAALDAGVEMYGPPRARNNIRNFRAVGGDAFARALERFAYAGLYRRKVLTPLDREVISVALLSCIERPNPLVWHAKAALRLGATPELLRHSVLGQTPVSGVLTAFRGIALLSPVLDDWRVHPATDAGA